MAKSALWGRNFLWSLILSGFFIAVQADALAPNASASGTLSTAHSEDLWTITTLVDGSLTVNVSTADAALLEQDANLYDVDGVTSLAHDGQFGTTSKLTFPNLLPGTYTVKVYWYSGTGASYSIDNSFVPQAINNNTEPNDSAAQAATITINATAPGHLGYYGHGFIDDADWFKIIIPSDGILTISALSDTTLEADLNLYDTNATSQLQHDGKYSRSSQVSMPNLKPGTYFFKYYKYSGYGGYNVTTVFTPQSIANDSEPNDTFPKALTLSANGSATGHLGYLINQITDSRDWYKIQLPSDGALRVFIETDTTLEADANIYDINGSTQIFHDGRYGDSTILALPNLATGTYYVNEYVYGGYGGYKTTSVFLPQPLANDAEPNDTLTQAVTLTMNQAAPGHLGYYSNSKTDANDWWSIVQPATGPLWVSVQCDSTLEADCDMIAASDLSLVSHDGQYGVHSYVGGANITAGKYLVNVRVYTGYGGYKITAASQQISTETSPQPRQKVANEMFSARAIGSKTVSLTFALKSQAMGSIRVYTSSGRLVSQVFKGRIEAGKIYEANIQGISSGVYYAFLSTENMNKILRINMTR